MSTRKHVFRLFSAWNDYAEARWLEQMAQSGWHLVSGPILYCFEKGAPARVRYALDYRSESSELPEYLKLCSDAGWERVMEVAGWQYFRTASADAPEIYTDSSSRIAKYRRLWTVAILLATTTMGANIPWLLSSSAGPRDWALIAALRWLVALIGIAWVYVFVRLAIFIRKQEREAGIRNGGQERAQKTH